MSLFSASIIFPSLVTSALTTRAGRVSVVIIYKPLICWFDSDAGRREPGRMCQSWFGGGEYAATCVCVRVLPQVDGADVPLNASGGAQHFATVLPQALEHHLHGVLQENTQQILLQTSGTAFCYNGTENKRNGNFSYRTTTIQKIKALSRSFSLIKNTIKTNQRKSLETL